MMLAGWWLRDGWAGPVGNSVLHRQGDGAVGGSALGKVLPRALVLPRQRHRPRRNVRRRQRTHDPRRLRRLSPLVHRQRRQLPQLFIYLFFELKLILGWIWTNWMRNWFVRWMLPSRKSIPWSGRRLPAPTSPSCRKPALIIPVPRSGNVNRLYASWLDTISFNSRSEFIIWIELLSSLKTSSNDPDEFIADSPSLSHALANEWNE